MYGYMYGVSNPTHAFLEALKKHGQYLEPQYWNSTILFCLFQILSIPFLSLQVKLVLTSAFVLLMTWERKNRHVGFWVLLNTVNLICHGIIYGLSLNFAVISPQGGLEARSWYPGFL